MEFRRALKFPSHLSLGLNERRAGSHVKRAASCLALMVLSSSAVAGRPLVTEDAGFIDRGGFELESYTHRQSARDTMALSGFHVQSNAGIGFNTQLGIGVDTLRQYNPAFDTNESTGEYAISGKTGIKELSDDAYGIAVAYGIDRTRAVGERFRDDNATINGAVTVPVGKWLLHANLGWQRSRLAATTATTWAFAVERRAAIGPLDLGVETFGNDHDPAWIQVGARWVVQEDRTFVDASYGLQAGSTDARQFTLGFKLVF
jgi:hypothetical protein